MSHHTGLEPARAWLRHALCAGPDYADQRDLWFPVGDSHRAAADRAEARRICAACPARMACLRDALHEEGDRAGDNRHGIRGGLTGKQRRRLYDRARTARQEREAA